MRNKVPVRSDQMAIQLTTQEKIQNVINHIVHLIEGGTLGEIEGKGLIACFDSAAKELDQGKIGAAPGILEAFVNKIEADVKSGKLPPAVGSDLVKATLNVLVD